MHWALRTLGLDADADERAIKRAYATRLKTTRPDEDPEGFQALNEAYRAALQWVQTRRDAAPAPVVPIPVVPIRPALSTGAPNGIDHAAADDANSAPDDRPADVAAAETVDRTAIETQPIDAGDAVADAFDAGSDDDVDGGDIDSDDSDEDVFDEDCLDEDAFDERDLDAVEDAFIPLFRPRPAEPVPDFDPDAFYDECVAIALRGYDGDLEHWLHAQPALWSLGHKAQIAQWLLHRLQAQRPPIEHRRFDVIAGFFGMNDLHAGFDAYWLHRIRHRLHVAWEVQTRQLHSLAARTGLDGGSMASNLRVTGRVLNQLTRPLRWPQALQAALMPGYPGAVRAFLYRLDFGDLDDLPPQIDADQIAFWEAAGDRDRLSKPRLAVGAFRCAVYSAIAILGMLLVKSMTPGVGIDPKIATMASLTVIGLMYFAWLSALGAQRCLAWLSLPDTVPAPLPWLRVAFVPLLAAVAVAMDRLGGYESGGATIAVTALAVSVHRYRRRNGPLFGGRLTLKVWHLALAVPAIPLIVWAAEQAPGFITLAIGGAALLPWAIDLRRRRAEADD